MRAGVRDVPGCSWLAGSTSISPSIFETICSIRPNRRPRGFDTDQGSSYGGGLPCETYGFRALLSTNPMKSDPSGNKSTGTQEPSYRRNLKSKFLSVIIVNTQLSPRTAAHPVRRSKITRTAFTLIELLLVIAIIA